MIERTKELTIESRLSEINKVEKFVEDLSDLYNINNTYFGNILIAVTEAVSNAIIHGNKSNEGKKVVICFRSEEKGLIFSVEDEGEGFKHESVTGLIEGSDEIDAKGLALIASLSDKMEWERKGRKVVFEFHIKSLNFAKSSERINMLKNYYTKEEEAVKSKKQKS